MQGMIVVPRKQGLLVDKHTHYLNKLAHIFTAFFRASKFLFEAGRAFGIEHGLTPQIGKKFVKRMECLRRNLPAEHGIAFGNRRHGLGVIGRAFCRGIVVLGADGAHARSVSAVLRGKRPRSGPSRLAVYVKQPQRFHVAQKIHRVFVYKFNRYRHAKQYTAFAARKQDLKQIGVGAGAVKQNASVLLVNAVHEQPVRLSRPTCPPTRRHATNSSLCPP